MTQPIPNYQLEQYEKPISFSIRTMEEIDAKHQGQRDLPHRHDYYTILWSYTATGQHFVDFQEYALLPDHIFFIGPGQVHQVLTDEQPTGIVILFTREFLQLNGIRETFITNLKLFQDCTDNAPLPIGTDQKERLKQYADDMLDTHKANRDFKYEALGAYLRLFLIECNNSCTLAPEHPSEALGGRQLLSQFKELVEREYKHWHKVGEYAEALAITPSYLNSVVKHFLGKTAKEYILGRILLEAKRLAVFSDLSAKQIGYGLGFEDPSNFSKFFRKTSGLTVAQFRKRETVPS